jgi:glycosyltransferase involved in cell wall biosynthesis
MFANFTVIIPTRERYDTLESTLKTCLNQNYEKLEIIVSDNFSQDYTQEVVSSFNDPRITYINTQKRLSMSKNWEFALSHVKNDSYVTFLGDDDGLLPNAIEEINKLVNQLGDVEAIAWQKTSYTWPNCIMNENVLSICLKSNLEKFDTKKKLKELIKFEISYPSLPYELLPCIYNAFVKNDKIKKVMQISGDFFCSMTPDVYSAIALSTVIDFHYFSHKPYSVNGASRHSNGVSGMQGKTEEENEAANKFLSENNIAFHSDLLPCNSIPIIISEAFLQAKDNLKIDEISLDIKKMIKIAVQEAVGTPKYDDTVETIYKIAIKHNLEDYAKMVIRQYPDNSQLKTKLRSNLDKLEQTDKLGRPQLFFGYDLLQKRISIDGYDFKLRNIYDACLLTDHLLKLESYNYYGIKRSIKLTIYQLTKSLLRKIVQIFNIIKGLI